MWPFIIIKGTRSVELDVTHGKHFSWISKGISSLPLGHERVLIE